MAKVCILVGEFWPTPSPNGVIAENLARELAREFDVTVVTRRTRLSMPRNEMHDGLRIVRVDDLHLIIHNALQTRIDTAGKWIRAMCQVLLFSTRASYWLCRSFRRHSVAWDFVSKLERALEHVNSREGIEVLLPVSAPHEETFAAMRYKELNPDSTLVIYQLDRFANADSLYELDIIRPARERRNRKLEERALEAADALFLLPPLLEHYSHSTPLLLRRKIVRTEHPLVRNMSNAMASSPSTPGRIVFLYAGSLDLRLRNPSFVLSVFGDERLRQLGIELVMYAYGSGAALVEQAERRDSAWLHYHRRVGIDEVHMAMARADILVTIGNNSDSEVPSKLFEYVSFGKPIVHFYFSRQDAYLDYLDRYPISLALKVGAAAELEEAIVGMISFCSREISDHISMEYVLEAFRACTPEFVARQFTEAFSEFRRAKS